MPESSIITIDDLDSLLSKYFKTQEQIELDNQQLLEEQQKLQEELDKLKEIENQENEAKELSSVEFHQELIQEIKTLQEYSKFGNNMFYVGMVAIGLILIYVLFYKFLKFFI